MAETLYVRIKSGEGFFEDVTQPDAVSGVNPKAGTLRNGEIKQMVVTKRLKEFLGREGLERLSENSDEVRNWKKEQAEAAKTAAATPQPKPEATTSNKALSEFAKHTKQAVKEGIREAFEETVPKQPENNTPPTGGEELGSEPSGDAENNTPPTGKPGKK